MRPSARPQLPRVLHARARRSITSPGLNIGGEPRPVLPVTIGDQASIRRGAGAREGRRAVRRPPPLRPQLRLRAADAEDRARRCGRTLGGWQVNGIVQAQTGFPADGRSIRTDIRYLLTNRPNVTCDPNDGRAAHDRPVVQHLVLRQRLRVAANAGTAGNAGAQHRARPRVRAHRPVVLQEHRRRRGQQVQLRVEAFNLFNQARFGQPAARSARRPSAGSPPPRTAGSCSSA